MGKLIKGGNFCTTASLLTATGTETVHDTTVLLQYAIRGKAYTKSGTNADQTTPTTDYNTGLVFPTLNASKGTVVVWAYNASGTVKCMMGASRPCSPVVHSSSGRSSRRSPKMFARSLTRF